MTTDRPQILGLHHVTAIAGDPQRNLDFYAGLLGLRLVKRTVNFDAPDSYHLYYGDAEGRPGTILTFFPWTNILFTGLANGDAGSGQVGTTTLAVPTGSIGFWTDRLAAAAIELDVTARFGRQLLQIHDPDGLRLELVGDDTGESPATGPAAPVPPEHAICGVHSATLVLEGYERTARLLTETLGFRLTGEEGGRFRFKVGADGFASTVDLLCRPGTARGRTGIGSVHHLALRVADDEAQRHWRRTLVEAGYDVSPVMDRSYFRSIYFREPGGVLFEIATDPPGFTVDEPTASLGEALMLPEWLERRRSRIEARLPELRLPGRQAVRG